MVHLLMTTNANAKEVVVAIANLRIPAVNSYN